ncbi:magnesium transporter [Pseudomarimonas salicorniae]|uniref:Magnesium transporter n=1 Tax=Pseudomarimonas salicorniae TaxID=2933270 RepID=A0ABT0GKM5_9GAMM|nr:magnesium transporter [Lysobacter sp. CAU 1642]MCK7595091.1 magnesium transporter [Lysobacter sp. CAU 1642]
MNEHELSSDRLSGLDAATATDRLRRLRPEDAAELLAQMPVGRASTVLAAMPEDFRRAILEVAPPGTDWTDAQSYPAGSIGRLLEDPPAIFLSGTTVRDAIEAMRSLIRKRMVVYLFVVDGAERLLGVVAFRELLYARPEQTLDEVMIDRPFTLHPRTPMVEAMREVVTKHFPVYPVCEDDGRLVGLVRGQVLFEQQAFDISAQAGAMVGVEKEERLATPFSRSFRFRHPWLQINLLTVFAAAAVVGFFEDAIDQLVVLALFIPVLAGQCGNLGAQSLAVVLRGMTLGELRSLPVGRLLLKEGLLGLLNGVITGAVAATAMFVLAHGKDPATALPLALATWVAMSLGCGLSGVAGAAIPVALRRAGADPATASAILLTTATDVVSMGLFLGLAAFLVL